MTELSPGKSRRQDGVHRTLTVYRIAYVVWNVVVFESVKGGDRFAGKIDELVSLEPRCRPLIDLLIARKRELFADDLRLIGEYKLTYTDGEIHVWAEARDPKRRA